MKGLPRSLRLQEPHVRSSYPVPSCAVPVSAGMVIAVPLELAASPLGSALGTPSIVGVSGQRRQCDFVVNGKPGIQCQRL